MSKSILDLFNNVTVAEKFAEQLDKTSILSCRLSMEKNGADIVLACDTPLDRNALFEYSEAIETVYNLDFVDIKMSITDYTPDDCYANGVLSAFLRKAGRCRPFLSEAAAKVYADYILIENIIGGEDMLKSMDFTGFIRNTISDETKKSYDVKLYFKEIATDEYLKHRDEETFAITQKKATESHTAKYKTVVSAGLLFGRAISEPVVPISSLKIAGEDEKPEKCVISGEVLNLSMRDLPGNPRFSNSKRSIITFALGDGEWACACKLVSDSEKLSGVKSSVSDGKHIKAMGVYEIDRYTRKPTFNISSLELLKEAEIREDNAKEKRVELHLHTKMSAMDGISSAKDLITRACIWGHKAIAITDHGVAQAFPDAHKALKDLHKDGLDIKIIYGIEGYLINDINPKSHIADINLNNTYVVFDIETTGLSPHACEIIEIGAVKIENGVITDRFSQLINPNMPIPAKITELTGITDDDVSGMPSIDEVLPQFLEFCKNSTVVAHNASFDCGFIKYNATKLNLIFDNKSADTLKLSRELFPNAEKHTLDAVCKRLDISLENHHRAVDDANATAEIFLKFAEMHKEKAENEKFVLNSDNIKSLSRYHIIILAKNYVGLKNLYQLISASNLEYFYKKPLMPRSLIEKYREGLIIGSACEAGELYRAIVEGQNDDILKDIASFYDYLEVQPLCNNDFMVKNGSVSSYDDLRNFNIKIAELGDTLGIPVAATCDVHFLDPEDIRYRKVLLGAQGFSDADDSPALYLRTTDEMLEEFSYLGEEKAREIVIDVPNKIADMIEEIQPVKDGSYPPSIENCEQDLIDMCHEKAHRIYGEVLPPIVQARMDKELDCITKYGYSVMYMIAHKLVKKSNEAGYLVGSRGSVGSSFAAFLSDITEVNALCPHYVCPNCKHSEWFENGEYPTGIDMPDKDCPQCGTKMKKDGLEIPFETFLGFKGDKVPDIDLNFSGEYQATAHKYVGELFGESYVFKAGTIGTIAEKTAIGFAKKYYELKGIDAPEEVLIQASKGLIDVKRTTGQHPGGIIVCPKTMDIHDFCPIQHPADKRDSDIITTHFDFHSIHDNLLKLDILGHDDPSTIRMLEDLTGLDALSLPLDDEKVMSLFSGTEALGVTPEQIGSKVGTFGVPEFGTSFVRGMLVDTKPTKFVELLIISGLSHGTDVWLNNAQNLVKDKTASLSEVIGLRDDIMVYLIHHNLEPSMAFKIMEFVRKGRAAKEGMPEEYETAMRENDVPDWYIDSCKKIKYMFPKAHAAAYVMMALRIAYFKVYYPLEFYTAYFTVRADLFDAKLMTNGKERVKNEMKRISFLGNSASANDKSLYTILELCLEMYERGFEFMPADIYKSHAVKFRIIDNKILPPLNAFQGVGESAAYSIMNAAKGGKFLSVEDLKSRSGITKAVVEVLTDNGVLKGLSETSQLDFLNLLG